MLDEPIEHLPRTSVVTIRKMKLLGINTYEDLLHNKPLRYEDYREHISLRDLQDKQKGTISGQILSAKYIRTRGRISIQKIEVQSDTGSIEVVFFNQPYVLSVLKKGLHASFSGAVILDGPKASFRPETFEIVERGGQSKGIHTGRLLPIYSEARGLSSKLIREKIAGLLSEIRESEETLPNTIVKNYGLLPHFSACEKLHNPSSFLDVEKAIKRFAFEELFILQLTTQLIKKQWHNKTRSQPIILTSEDKKKVQDWEKSLPYKLTGDQQKAIQRIIEDMQKKEAMNRFLQGDVGSGKTVVSIAAAYAAYLRHKKTLYMAPTEILAQQQANTFRTLLKHWGVTVELVTGSTRKHANREKADVLIGTHALLHTKKPYTHIGLVVIDEQHRFGVSQRSELRDLTPTPHFLTMTATPIPRTVALTVFGELNMSILSSFPVGKLPIKTYVVPEQKRSNAYNWILKQIKTLGIQAFIICPLVEESASESVSSVRAAKSEYTKICTIFPDLRVGLLHGKMKSKEKETVMAQFKEKIIDVLVSTSVVEVGIDIANATIILIEGADRFGLAQLHQLRGRVGRGTKQSYCFLFPSHSQSNERLHFFARTTNGMELAEFDLKTRGPGNMFGIQQHGFLNLSFASLLDIPLIESVQRAVSTFIAQNSLNHFPHLQNKIKQMMHIKIHND